MAANFGESKLNAEVEKFLTANGFELNHKDSMNQVNRRRLPPLAVAMEMRPEPPMVRVWYKGLDEPVRARYDDNDFQIFDKILSSNKFNVHLKFTPFTPSLDNVKVMGYVEPETTYLQYALQQSGNPYQEFFIRILIEKGADARDTVRYERPGVMVPKEKMNAFIFAAIEGNHRLAWWILDVIFDKENKKFKVDVLRGFLNGAPEVEIQRLEKLIADHLAQPIQSQDPIQAILREVKKVFDDNSPHKAILSGYALDKARAQDKAAAEQQGASPSSGSSKVTCQPPH